MAEPTVCHTSRMPSSATFLLQFQEKHPLAESAGALCATQTLTATSEDADQDPAVIEPILGATATMTKTVEDPDQDPQLPAWYAGTQTLTETHETPDADPQSMGTQTGTRTIESPDQDATIRSYFAIPRATCCSS